MIQNNNRMNTNMFFTSKNCSPTFHTARSAPILKGLFNLFRGSYEPLQYYNNIFPGNVNNMIHIFMNYFLHLKMPSARHVSTITSEYIAFSLVSRLFFVS